MRLIVCVCGQNFVKLIISCNSPSQRGPHAHCSLQCYGACFRVRGVALQERTPVPRLHHDTTVCFQVARVAADYSSLTLDYTKTPRSFVNRTETLLSSWLNEWMNEWLPGCCFFFYYHVFWMPCILVFWFQFPSFTQTVFLGVCFRLRAL